MTLSMGSVMGKHLKKQFHLALWNAVFNSSWVSGLSLCRDASMAAMAGGLDIVHYFAVFDSNMCTIHFIHGAWSLSCESYALRLHSFKKCFMFNDTVQVSRYMIMHAAKGSCMQPQALTWHMFNQPLGLKKIITHNNITCCPWVPGSMARKYCLT